MYSDAVIDGIMVGQAWWFNLKTQTYGIEMYDAMNSDMLWSDPSWSLVSFDDDNKTTTWSPEQQFLISQEMSSTAYIDSTGSEADILSSLSLLEKKKPF